MSKFFIVILCLFTLAANAQETFSRTKLPGGKLKYEYKVHKKRDHLVKDFFDLFCDSRTEWIIQEGSCTAVARQTKKGFEIVGDANKEKFDCPMANLLIDLWYEYAHVNSN